MMGVVVVVVEVVGVGGGVVVVVVAECSFHELSRFGSKQRIKTWLIPLTATRSRIIRSLPSATGHGLPLELEATFVTNAGPSAGVTRRRACTCHVKRANVDEVSQKVHLKLLLQLLPTQVLVMLLQLLLTQVLVMLLQLLLTQVLVMLLQLLLPILLPLLHSKVLPLWASMMTCEVVYTTPPTAAMYSANKLC